MAAEQQDDEPAEYRVSDPEEFNQTQRLRTINRIREQAGEAIQATMTQLRTEDDFSVEDRQQILRAAVYRYLTEIEWLAFKAEDDELLHGKEFGEVQLNPPAHLRKAVNNPAEAGVRVIGKPDLKPWTYTITGIEGYLTAPEIFEASWTVRLDTRHGGPQAVQESEWTYMPAHISLNAYRLANQFLAKNGIDVELAEEQHRAVVDNELMEEIETWRQKHIK